MNSVPLEFLWTTEGPANGTSGQGLAKSLIEIIEELKGVETICDLGCGNGYVAGQLAALNYSVVGVDSSKSGLQIARAKNPDLKFVEASIDRSLGVELEKSDFDLVVSSDVVEHLYRPADLFEAALALLKPQGHFVVCAPYHGYLKNLALSVTGRMDAHFSALHDGGHIKFFSVKTLSQLMRSHGFTDLHFSFYGRAPWLWKNMICCARKPD